MTIWEKIFLPPSYKADCPNCKKTYGLNPAMTVFTVMGLFGFMYVEINVLKLHTVLVVSTFAIGWVVLNAISTFLCGFFDWS